ncbi:MAG: hypothetical protein A2Y86_09795 [Candidatus Aminicenantes bacterium RBG_13_62_12]|nr:MAG: hypothetical protein A2Y86_09795 [Candidatus Aminicenantes bacterium RBG_13_62_12]
MRADVKLPAVVSLAAILLAGCCSPSRTVDQMTIGLWASRQQLWDEAIYRWRRALEADPRSAAAHNNLAVAYETKGLWEEARKAYEAALALAPQNSLIQSNFSRFKQNLEGRESRGAEPAKKKNP